MQLTICLQDQEGNVLDGIDWAFEEQIKLRDLKEWIEWRFNVKKGWQRLFLHGKQIIGVGYDKTLSDAGFAPMDTVIVQHVFLRQFDFMRELINITNPVERDNRDVAKWVRTHKATLDCSDFFAVYVDYYLYVLDHYPEFVRCLNYDPSVMFESVKSYLGGKNVKLVNEEKPGGINAGFIFTYTHEGTTEKYYLKTIGGRKLDVRELIVYILLGNIGVGPSKCVFIPNVAQSKNVIYIATLEVPGFTMARELKEPLEAKAAVELHLLAVIFGLTDLNTGNYGLDSSNSLSIVDFSLQRNDVVKDSSCTTRFKEGQRLPEAILSTLNKCTSWERVKIGKEALKRWDLDGVLDRTMNDFRKIKEELRSEVGFLERSSKDIEGYWDIVKSNLRNLISEWDRDICQ